MSKRRNTSAGNKSARLRQARARSQRQALRGLDLPICECGHPSHTHDDCSADGTTNVIARANRWLAEDGDAPLNVDDVADLIDQLAELAEEQLLALRRVEAERDRLRRAGDPS